MNQVATSKFADLSPELKLRRLTNSFMLFPNVSSNPAFDNNVRAILPECDPTFVKSAVVDLRDRLVLRKPPLYLISEMFKLSKTLGPAWSKAAGEALVEVCERPDDLTETLGYYWAGGQGNDAPLPYQFKKAVKAIFPKFDEYQLGKYQSGTNGISLRDVMFLCHVKPKDAYRGKWVAADRKKVLEKVRVDRSSPLSPGEYLQHKLTQNLLDVPATRETLLSESSSPEEKRNVYQNLMTAKKLPAMAFLKNLNTMKALGVPSDVILQYGLNLDLSRVAIGNFMTAVVSAPEFQGMFEGMFLKKVRSMPKLKGKTVFVADISGSMQSDDIKLGATSTSRMAAMHLLLAVARECCEKIRVYATAGMDGEGYHATAEITSFSTSGLSLFKSCELQKYNMVSPSGRKRPLGSGGIFTRQALDYIRTCEDDVERIIVVSDSQDCDRKNKVPSPFGKYNYLINIGASQQSINYSGVWTDEIQGWAPNFIDYIAECEKEL